MPGSCNVTKTRCSGKITWMKEFLGYSIVLAAAALHMSPKTTQHCVLKCLSMEEVKACAKFRETKNT